MKTRPWSELRQKMLRKSPICCANYLLTCAEDEERIFLKALNNIYEAWKDKLEATFPRSSQNQTASSGVEGAHEGTTADKSELLPTQLPKEKK